MEGRRRGGLSRSAGDVGATGVWAQYAREATDAGGGSRWRDAGGGEEFGADGQFGVAGKIAVAKEIAGAGEITVAGELGAVMELGGRSSAGPWS